MLGKISKNIKKSIKNKCKGSQILQKANKMLKKFEISLNRKLIEV